MGATTDGRGLARHVQRSPPGSVLRTPQNATSRRVWGVQGPPNTYHPAAWHRGAYRAGRAARELLLAGIRVSRGLELIRGGGARIREVLRAHTQREGGAAAQHRADLHRDGPAVCARVCCGLLDPSRQVARRRVSLVRAALYHYWPRPRGDPMTRSAQVSYSMCSRAVAGGGYELVTGARTYGARPSHRPVASPYHLGRAGWADGGCPPSAGWAIHGEPDSVGGVR